MQKTYFTIFTIALLSSGYVYAAEASTDSSAGAIMQTANQAATQDGQNKRKDAGQSLDAASLASKALCNTLMLASMAAKDPKKKEELKDMAMMACMQAAANQKAGEENNSGANSLNNGIPQFAGYQAPAVAKAPTDSDEPTPLVSETPFSSNSSPYDGLIDIPEIKVPDLSGGGAAPGSLTTTDPNAGKEGIAKGQGFTALTPNDPSGLTYESEAKEAQAATGGIGAIGGIAKTPDVTAASPTLQNGKIDAPLSIRALAKGDGSEANAEEVANGGAGDAAFDSLMAQLMGPGAGADGMMAGAFGGYGGFSDIRFMAQNPKMGTGFNIFQAASQTYQESHSQGKILTREQRVPSRQLASVKP